MKAAAVIAMMVAALSPVAVKAQDARIDPVETPRMFREAVLGYCAERIHGTSMIPHSISLDGPDWTEVRRDVQTSGGQRIFAGRMNTATGIIVDVSPGATTCFVQINMATSVFEITEDLRLEILARPGATQLDERTTPEGHHTLFGLLDPDNDAVPIFAVNDTGPEGSVATAIVGTASKGN